MIAKLDQRHKKPSEISSNGKSDSNGQHDDFGPNLGEGDFSGDFQRRFYGERSSIIESMEQVRNEVKTSSKSTSTAEKIESLANRASKLQTILNESTSVLPSYEIRKATTSLQELQEILKRARADFQPQKRFAFTSLKSSTKPTASSSVPSANGNSNGADVIDGHSSTISPSNVSAAAVVIENRRNDANIVLSEADCRGKDVLLLDCHSCTIRLLGISTTVHAKELIDCTILTYPVSTSIFIERCQRSTFVVACQQLRMHTSIDCDLYLHVTTAAIIEDCQKLRFAPYIDVLDDTTADQLLHQASLDPSKNAWNRVQDFNWLVIDQPSPNWQLIPNDQWRRFRLSIQ